ncbi:MAG: hypothetical protein NXH97_05510 [Rhodobacteraceae bacterium]|nr:hypothetical protein [Paracoccaceae bacterium]
MFHQPLSVETHPAERTRPSRGVRVATFAYGAAAYLLFLVVFAYMAGFLLSMIVPKAINDASAFGATPFGIAIIVNFALIALFGRLHSLLARNWAKRRLWRIMPRAAERSTFVVQSSLCLALAMWQWRPLTETIWHVDGALALAAYGVFAIGVTVVLWSTFLIDHFELFGLRQIWCYLRGLAMIEPQFRTPSLYRIVRHPMQLGIVILLFATPHMTLGHLLFAGSMTGYIFAGLYFEERALLSKFGPRYLAYQQSVPKLFPNPRRLWVKHAS